jgi:hypothetical protein
MHINPWALSQGGRRGMYGEEEEKYKGKFKA